MNYKYIFFDLDGTLTNPEEGIINSICYSLEKMSLPIPDEAVLKTFIGPPLKYSFMETMHLDEETAEVAIKHYRSYFAEKGWQENYVYEGIIPLLEQLTKSYDLFVATSKPEVFAQRILDHFELIQYFKGIYGATMDGVRSKKGDVIRYALETENIKNLNEVLMIGDTKFDIYGAYENGITSVGVLWGIDDKAKLEQAQATFLISKPEELLNILQIRQDYILEI